MATRQSRLRSATGIPVDRSGGPTIDPTENVIALVKAGEKRADDIRDLEGKLTDVRLTHVEQISKIRSDHSTEIGNLRAEHAKEIAAKEASRLDAIQQVNVLTQNTAQAQSLLATQTLAAKAATDADTLRATVANTATASATQQATQFGMVNDRVSALERSQSTAAGKSSYVDPQLIEIMADMKKILTTNAGTSGRTEGSDSTIKWILGLVAAAGVLWGIYQSRQPVTFVPEVPIKAVSPTK
jgi:hypothetical protein